MVEVNGKCPDFESVDENENVVSLEKLKGSNFILYFYPKDDTPGCTIEANDFNKLKPEFEKLNCQIFGVSKDSHKSHKAFKEKYCLEFPLIVDSEEKLCKTFDVIKEKSMFGKKYMGISRDTFLINKEGVVVSAWRNVSAAGHAKEVFEKLKNL